MRESRTEGLEEEYTVELRDTREVPAPTGATRSTAYYEPAIELEAPAPGGDWGQVVLAVDEAGMITWNFPVERTGATEATRGGPSGTNTYVIRRYVPEGAAEPGSRGIVGAVGKKILKVLGFPSAEDVAGKVGDYFANRWEKAKRPYRVRAFGPDDYQQAEAAPIEGAAWERLASGRALLLLHGTFSRAHSGFGKFAAGEWLSCTVAMRDGCSRSTTSRSRRIHGRTWSGSFGQYPTARILTWTCCATPEGDWWLVFLPNGRAS